jgi:hypothetical protein
MNLVITIDTEEDDWGVFRRTGHRCVNIERIPFLQEVFDRYAVKPTYLVTYPVATDPKAVSVLGGLLDKGKCEIGSHCHPWNTPPFEEKTGVFTSMLCNLPQDLQYRKLEALHAAIFKSFGTEPRSFRAGRWGFGKSVAENLLKLDYCVDSSVLPLCDWSLYHGPDYTKQTAEPYLIRGHGRKCLVEVPATMGFAQRRFRLCRRIITACRAYYLQGLHIPGLLKRLGLITPVSLSPEESDGGHMARLSRACAANGYKCLNMWLHSTSLLPGLSPFVPDEAACGRLLSRISRFLDHAAEEGMGSQSLSAAGSALRAELDARPEQSDRGPWSPAAGECAQGGETATRQAGSSRPGICPKGPAWR